MLLSLPERRGFIPRASDFATPNPKIFGVMMPGQDVAVIVRPESPIGWPVRGAAIQVPQVVWISVTQLEDVVNSIDVRTVAGNPVTVVTHGVGSWWDLLNPTTSFHLPWPSIADVIFEVFSVRGIRTYVIQQQASASFVPVGVAPQNAYLFAPCTNLMAPVVLPPEPWIGSDFLHIHIGPPASALDYRMFADDPNTAGKGDGTHPIDIRTLPTDVGLVALNNNLSRFRRYAIKVFGPQQDAYQVTGDGTLVPTDVADAADVVNDDVPASYRALLKTHGDIVNGLGVDGLSYEYLGENPRASDLVQVIADHFGFDVG